MTTTPTHANNFTFYATTEYFERLIADIDATKQGDRVFLATMAYEPEVPIIAKLTTALGASAQRGATVNLSVDAYNFLIGDHHRLGPLWWHNTLPKKPLGTFGAIQVLLDRLRSQGVRVTVTNLPSKRFSVPFAGRSHIKLSLINDKIYLGGCNLGEQHYDCMVSWRDAKTADWLYATMNLRTAQPQSLAAFGHEDLCQIMPQGEILLDVGVKRQSAIYDQALEIIDRAQDWLVITCQFFPNSRTAQHLKAAHQRGVKVFPIFNHYGAHAPPHPLLQHAVTARERLRMPASFFQGELPAGSTFLHAKIIATEQEAIIGSHNYVPAGVNFGTAEIAMHQKNSDFAKAAAQLIVTETGLADRPECSFLFD